MFFAFLVVRGDELHELRARLERGARSRGIGNAAIPVAGSNIDALTEVRRVDGPKKSWSACGSTPDFASVTLATIVGRPLESCLRDDPDGRRPDVVDPRAQRVATGERATGEEVASGVDGDVVAPGRQEHAAGSSDRVEEVGKLAVHVHRDSRVAEDVVLVERAHEPRMNRLVRAEERRDRRVELRLRPHHDDACVDGLLLDVERVDLLLAVVVHRRVDAEDPEDRERRCRPPIDASAVLAGCGCLPTEVVLRAATGRARQRRPRDREGVGDPPHVAPSPKEDEPEVVTLHRAGRLPAR